LFIVKGLHNYSNLPSGDMRVMRSSTSIHEQFIQPVDRAKVRKEGRKERERHAEG
jgi:hypothetical protein